MADSGLKPKPNAHPMIDETWRRGRRWCVWRRGGFTFTAAGSSRGGGGWRGRVPSRGAEIGVVSWESLVFVCGPLLRRWPRAICCGGGGGGWQRVGRACGGGERKSGWFVCLRDEPTCACVVLCFVRDFGRVRESALLVSSAVKTSEEEEGRTDQGRGRLFRVSIHSPECFPDKWKERTGVVPHEASVWCCCLASSQFRAVSTLYSAFVVVLLSGLFTTLLK